MAITALQLASGHGWHVSDMLCNAGRHDRPFEERHDWMCIALVTEGSFQYRSTSGAALLTPGSLMLGNHHHGYECDHDHDGGDRCLSFRLSPEFMEQIAAQLPGVQPSRFLVPRMPQLESLAPLMAAAETARDERDAAALEELAVRITAAVLTLQGEVRAGRSPTSRDRRRVSDALRWMVAHLRDRLALNDLARLASMSPYHFLRTFQEVVGITPHQYVLRTRLKRACIELRRSDAPISTIAYGLGFGDLSTFNRQFRRMVKQSPSAYRG